MNDVLILVRFVHYTAAMLLFGLAVFEGALLPADQRGGRFAVWAMRVLVPVMALSAIGWFLLEAGEIGNGWSDAFDPAFLATVAGGTAFGQGWMLHLGIAALIVAAFVSRAIGQRTMIVLSGAMLASHALVGHAAMVAGVLGWLHRASDMLHLVAAGFWLGSLPPLIACLVAMRSPTRREGAVLALRRFSGLGHLAVAVVLVTGIINVWLTLGTVPTNFSSPYQLLLAIKIGLVAAMVGIALTNRYAITPRLVSSGSRLLIANAGAEVVLGAVVVALVSAFATFDPM